MLFYVFIPNPFWKSSKSFWSKAPCLSNLVPSNTSVDVWETIQL